MSLKSLNNKYLKVGLHVVLNKALDDKIAELDKYWEGKTETVTSGVRNMDDQLRIIRKYLVSKGLDKKYPEAMTKPVDMTGSDGNYFWQMAWSHLLSIGLIINPPLPAKVLMDYIRNGKNKKGQIIGMSPHTRGTAFDISGIDSLEIVKQLLKEGKIRGYVLERENNCLHIDI